MKSLCSKAYQSIASIAALKGLNCLLLRLAGLVSFVASKANKNRLFPTPKCRSPPILRLKDRVPPTVFGPNR